MTETQFKQAVKSRAKNERAVGDADHADILVKAKQKAMVMLGQDPGSASINFRTVSEYEKCLGGDDDPTSITEAFHKSGHVGAGPNVTSYPPAPCVKLLSRCIKTSARRKNAEEGGSRPCIQRRGRSERPEAARELGDIPVS